MGISAGTDHYKECCAVCGEPMVRCSGWLAKCPGCGFLASTLPPGAGTGIEGLETTRKANFEKLLDRLEEHRKLVGLLLLEVGCAKGLFLDAARRRGAEVRGIEPEVSNATIAREKGFTVESGFFPGECGGPYDVIAFNDVFEHIPNPAQALKSVERALKPGGIALLNLPTSDGVLYRVGTALDRLGFSAPFERLWQKGLPSPHVSYFNEHNLNLLARNHTQLIVLDHVRLSTISRRGLYDRVKCVNGGLIGDLLFAGAWLFSFVADVLPADIEATFLVHPIPESDYPA